MTPSLSSLLAYRERDQHSADRHRQPWDPRRSGVRLVEADGREAYFLIPAPANLARVFAAPLLGETLELFRGPSGLLARPLGASAAPTRADTDTAAATLAAALRALPARPYSSALQSYSFLRSFAALAPPAELDRYAQETVAALARRADLREWRTPKLTRDRSTKTSSDYAREQRARDTEDARALIAKWAPSLPAGRHELGAAWAAYLAALDAAPERVSKSHAGAFVIGRRAFYALLRELFEVVPGGGHRQLVVIPSPNNSTQEEPVNADPIFAAAVAYRELADARRENTAAMLDEVDAAERLLAVQAAQLAAGDRAGALHTQAERLATGTDGEPVDLGAYRAARAG